MKGFKLDPRLLEDCHIMGQLPVSELLLMNNAHYLWLILVPRTVDTEFHALAPELQTQLIKEVNDIAAFVKCIRPTTDKINIAMIGNIVRQLHVHIVGRQVGDPAWPGVVWGSPKRIAYAMQDVATLRSQLQSAHIQGYSGS